MEFELLVMGSSRSDRCLFGRSVRGEFGIVKKVGGWSTIVLLIPLVNSFTCFRR